MSHSAHAQRFREALERLQDDGARSRALAAWPFLATVAVAGGPAPAIPSDSLGHPCHVPHQPATGAFLAPIPFLNPTQDFRAVPQLLHDRQPAVPPAARLAANGPRALVPKGWRRRGRRGAWSRVKHRRKMDARAAMHPITFG
jgi:hypothetical protein